jgi:glucosamine-phosphate N-acetyltransferase
MEELSINDYRKYLNFLKCYREIQEMTYEEFLEIYSRLVKTTRIYIMKEPLNKNIIGSISIIIEQKLINKNGKVAHIEDLIISPSYRGKGIGSKLLNYAKEIAINENCYKIILNCDENIEDFYKKNDFSKYSISMKYNIKHLK